MKDTFAAWEHLFQEKAFDTTQNLHFISANEIKAITKREPRIMAKIRPGAGIAGLAGLRLSHTGEVLIALSVNLRGGVFYTRPGLHSQLCC